MKVLKSCRERRVSAQCERGGVCGGHGGCRSHGEVVGVKVSCLVSSFVLGGMTAGMRYGGGMRDQDG